MSSPHLLVVGAMILSLRNQNGCRRECAVGSQEVMEDECKGFLV